MSGLLGVLLKWLTGDLTNALIRAHEMRQRAQTDAQKLAAEKRIALIEAQQAIVVAEQRNRLTRWIRPVIAAPFAIYVWKIIVWDKVFGLGATDPLSAEFHEIMLVVLGAYFLARPFEKWRSLK